MCLLENELESQLGEFHVRMKGTMSCSIPILLPACLPACCLLMPLCLLLQDWQALPGFVLVTSMRFVGPYGLGSALPLPCCPWDVSGV